MATRWISAVQAAFRLRLTYGHVRNLICQGKLKGYQVDGPNSTWLVDRADVERYALARGRRLRAEATP